MEKIKKETFDDLVKQYSEAKTVDEIKKSAKKLIKYMQDKITDVEVEIEGFCLHIENLSNKSLSSEVISNILQIDIKRIDGRSEQHGIWSIKL